MKITKESLKKLLELNNFENFAHLASGVKNIIITIAIIIGGVWSAYTFGALNSVEKAKKELEKTKKELNELSLDIDIDAKQLPSLDKKKFGILVEVIIANVGNGSIALDLQKKPLTISKIAKNKKGIIYAAQYYAPLPYMNLTEGNTHLIYSQLVHPGSTKRIYFYEEVKSPGIYFISFQSKADKEVNNRVSKSTVGKTDENSIDETIEFDPNLIWGTHKFIELKI